MSDLSPAANAVIEAYSKAMVYWYNSAPPLHERPVGAHPHNSSMAAVMRAVADQVVPQGGPFLMTASEERIRHQLLAIAAELDK